MTDHLSEYQRHGAADGSLSPSEMAEVSAHAAACDACRADVDRIGALVGRLRDNAGTAAVRPDEWPAIRARIEQRKVVPLDGANTAAPRRDLGRQTKWRLVAAAAILAAIGTMIVVQRTPHPVVSDERMTAGALTPVVDSMSAYRDEAQRLLNQLALQRATLRPETAAAIDQNLRVIDAAIAELQAALARDPNDPALRRLLASSYREKVDLLKRLDNAS